MRFSIRLIPLYFKIHLKNNSPIKKTCRFCLKYGQTVFEGIMDKLKMNPLEKKNERSPKTTREKLIKTNFVGLTGIVIEATLVAIPGQKNLCEII